MPEWMLQLLTACAGAAGTYAAIRADLAALHVKADQAHQAAEKAHSRIDALLDHRRT